MQGKKKDSVKFFWQFKKIELFLYENRDQLTDAL